ncbi:unnamed protein product [Adineta steineri]|uniref:Uncharacterized protein n=3 Tax=Adineta steineri TaxID=433720 RepID=A0A814J6N5_9BILA|nr:unnamed protein product [Adineta steineri]
MNTVSVENNSAAVNESVIQLRSDLHRMLTICSCSKYRSYAGVCAFAIFTCLSIIAGVLIVCLTYPKNTNNICELTFERSAQYQIEYDSNPRYSAVGDLNHDGYQDIIVVNSGADNLGIFFGNGNGSFITQTTYSLSSGSNPYTAAVEDFNKDNHLDIVVANYGSHSIEILFGDGNGYFKDPIEISLGSSRPVALAVGYLNKDDQLDIAIVNYGMLTVTILAGYNNGSFRIEATYDMGYDSIPYSLTISDFNNDQQNDIAVVNFGTDDLTILLANHDGTFTITKYSTGKGSNPSSIAVGDFNKDGIQDIAISNSGTGNIAIFQGYRDGSFVNIISFSKDVNFQPQFIRVADFNNDTYLDIVAANSINGEINIFIGQDNWNFSLKTTHSIGLNSFSCSIAISDFDNDNILDIITTNNGTNSITILTSYTIYPNTTQTAYSTGENSVPGNIAVADINQDGYLDIVVTNTNSSSIGIFINNGNGTFNDPQVYNTFNSTGQQLIVVDDFNNDTYLDIAIDIMTNENILVILFGYGNETFRYGNPYYLNTTISFDSMASGFLNDDNYLDLVLVTVNSHNIVILLGSGDGSFMKIVSSPNGNNFTPREVIISDVNNDNISDIAMTDINHSDIVILLGYGNGSFFNSIVISTENDGPIGIAIRDINNDHILDIVYTSSANSIVGVLLGYGNGTFGSIARYSTDRSSLPWPVVLIDFNNDTFMDIVIVNSAACNMEVFVGLGNGSFTSYMIFSTGLASFPVDLASGDFNNDKQPDLVVSNGNSNEIGVFLVYYEADFKGEISYTTGSGSHPYSVVVRDFNNDNQSDIAVANSGNDQIELLFDYNNGTFKNKVILSTGLNSRPEFLTTADFNQDKQQDIIVANVLTGIINIFLGFGNGTFDIPTTYSTGSESLPISIATADFNNDNRTDFVVANQGTNEIDVFIAFNYVKFTNSTIFITDPGSVVVYSVTADFNNDHLWDIATVDFINSKMIVFLGYGNRTFAKPVSYSTGPSSEPYTMAVSDFNMDNQVDIVVVNKMANNIGVFLGYGNGSFEAQVTYSTGNLSTPASIATGDLNNDNITDIVVSNKGANNVAVFLGHTNGIITMEAMYPMPEESSPVWVSIADLNNDQNQDIIVANQNANNIGVLFGYGNGSFESVLTYTSDNTNGPVSVAAGDLNNDGWIDVVVANSFISNIVIFFAIGNNTISSTATYLPRPFLAYVSISIKDVNNDTHLDIIAIGFGPDTGGIHILFGFGNGNFTILTFYSPGFSLQLTSIAIHDFDNDDRVDFVITCVEKGSLYFMFQDGYDLFVTPWIYSTDDDSSRPASIAVGDVNNDQCIDIVVANSGTNNIGIFLGLGNGQFIDQTNYSTGDNSHPSSIIVVDINNNKQLDVAVANTDANNICIFFDYQNGNFSNIILYSTGTSSAPSSITSAYLNQDNYLDFIVTASGTNKILVFFGSGNGTFDEPKLYALQYNARPQSVTVGDIDGNGLMDIVVANAQANYVEVLLQICQFPV